MMLALKFAKGVQIRSLPIISTQRFNFSDDKKDSKDETPKKVKKHETTSGEGSATDRLNKLLTSMQTDDNKTLVKSVEIPKPVSKKQKAEKTKKAKEVKEDKPKNLAEAAKKVAELTGEDKRQTESELLSKLLHHIEGTSPSVSDVKKTLENGGDLKDLIVGMKIDRTKPGPEAMTRGQFVRKALDGRQSRGDQYDGGMKKTHRRQAKSIQYSPSGGSVKLFGEESLGIFKNKDELQTSPDILSTWDYLSKRELKLSVTHPPANYYEKMILWTEQGKLWKFPINNEQGLEDEETVDFSEHVFLEQHLEGWCPNKGPIRHFMELVCVGLSQNPYITAVDKMEHILWYKDYFEKKKDLLKDIIVQNKMSSETTKSIEK